MCLWVALAQQQQLLLPRLRLSQPKRQQQQTSPSQQRRRRQHQKQLLLPRLRLSQPKRQQQQTSPSQQRRRRQHQKQLLLPRLRLSQPKRQQLGARLIPLSQQHGTPRKGVVIQKCKSGSTVLCSLSRWVQVWYPFVSLTLVVLHVTASALPSAMMATRSHHLCAPSLLSCAGHPQGCQLSRHLQPNRRAADRHGDC
jgi:hypothetical protein